MMAGSCTDQMCLFINRFCFDLMQLWQIIMYFYMQGNKTIETMDIQEG